jgi:hypothetical protein
MIYTDFHIDIRRWLVEHPQPRLDPNEQLRVSMVVTPTPKELAGVF